MTTRIVPALRSNNTILSYQAVLADMDEHVAQMLANDVIEPANSPWASNVVMVGKKDGKLRFCIDYRKLNLVTRKDIPAPPDRRVLGRHVRMPVLQYL